MYRLSFKALLVCLTLSSALVQGQGQEPGRRTPAHPVKLEVHGQVRYGGGSVPAANILVRLEVFSGGIAAQMMTDRDGKFRFTGLAPTQYTLTIRAPGYREYQQQVELLTKTSDYLSVHLLPEVSMRESLKRSKSIGYINSNVPPEARKEFEKAETAMLEGKDLERAIIHLEKAVSLFAQFYEAEISLGTAYMDLRKWDKAEVALLRAVAINPKAANALFALGEVYFQQGRLEEAEKTHRNGLSSDNRSWQGHFALARVYWQKGDLVNTGRQLALTLQLNPEVADAHLLAGYVFLRAGKPNDALPEFEEYVRLAPKGRYVAQAREAAQRIKGQPVNR